MKIDDTALDNMRSNNCPCNSCKGGEYSGMMGDISKITMNSLYGQPKNYQNLIPANTITLTEENMSDYSDTDSMHAEEINTNYSPRHAARHARATETPNVVIENPKIRKIIGTTLDIALLILFTATAVDMASETIDISAFTVSAMAGVGALRAGFGLVVTNPNTPHEKA